MHHPHIGDLHYIGDLHVKDAVKYMETHFGCIATAPKNDDPAMVGIYRVSAPCGMRLAEVAGELVEEEAVCR